MELTFNTIQLENCFFPSLCTCDHVEVRDGQSASSPELETFCGDNKPSPLRSSGRYLWVEFHSDSRTVGNGFSASYRAVTKYAKIKCHCCRREAQLFISLSASVSLSRVYRASLPTLYGLPRVMANLPLYFLVVNASMDWQPIQRKLQNSSLVSRTKPWISSGLINYPVQRSRGVAGRGILGCP